MLQRKHLSFTKNNRKGLFHMSKILSFEEIEKYKQQIKELFAEKASTKVYDTWADTFEIESIDKKRVFVVYYGERRVKKFKRKCKKLLKKSKSSS